MLCSRHDSDTAAAAGVYFYLYSKLRTWALEALQARGKAMTGDIGVGPSLLVAFLAGCGNVLATNPIWVVSTRMQVTSGYDACSPACADLFGACRGWLQGGLCPRHAGGYFTKWTEDPGLGSCRISVLQYRVRYDRASHQDAGPWCWSSSCCQGYI